MARRRTTRRRPARAHLSGVSHPQRRVRALLLGTLIVFSLFAAQLVRLQGLDAATVSAAAIDDRLREVTIPAVRGDITDSTGTPLAHSVERKHITADPVWVAQYATKVDGTTTVVGYEGAARDIAEVTGADPQRLLQTLRDNDGRRWTYLVKDVSPKTWQDVDALDIPGIHAEDYLRRSYPLGASHAPLVGWVGDGEQPAGGVEQIAHDLLSGEPGTRTYELGGLGEVITTGTSDEVPAVPGGDVRLTIDSDLHWYAYNALANRVEESGGVSGYAIVQEVKTGKLLAAASYPAHDPAKAPKGPEDLRNALVEDTYEPGSTGKLITAIAALEEGLVEPETPIELVTRLPRGGTRFKDSHDPDEFHPTFARVLATSSNIGTILYGELLEDETFMDYLYKLGVGSTTGIGLPGESPGVVLPLEDWSATSKFTMLFGQGYASNALQQIGVFQTVANGGVYVPPSVVEGTFDEEGVYHPAEPRQEERRVSAETSRTLTEIMEYVPTKEGSAPMAAVEGYRVAGKTSTASRIDPETGRYSGVTAAFIGYAPAEDPQYVVSVTVQRPTRISQWGGVIAGPTFADIMRYVLQTRGVEPSTTTTPEIAMTYDPDAQAEGFPPGVTNDDIALKPERPEEDSE